MALISPAEAVGIRAALAVFLVHTYERQAASLSSTDDGYGGTVGAGDPVTGLPCRYRPTDRLRLSDGERMTVSTPVLTVPHDDPIGVGDLVSNVRDADGVLLLAGPLAVETIEPAAGLGPTLKKRAVLRGGDSR